jgi:uncharacterized protein (TIGR02594 family)
MAKYIVTTSALRIRSGPGLTFSTIGMLYKNNFVQGAELQGDWIHITASDNKVGWSHRAYLDLVAEEPQPPSGETAYRVDASTLNLRQGPGLNYAVIGSLKQGETVTGLAVSGDNQWAQIRKTNGITGWSSLKYLTKVTPPSEPTPTDVKMTVTAATLNFRSGPGEGYPVTGQLKSGEVVMYLNATPDWKWVNIKTGANATGWASSRYLSESNDLLAPAEDYPATGLHRALSDVIPLRHEPHETAAEVAPMNFNRVVKVNSLSPDGKWKHCTNAWGESGWYPIERLARLGDVVIQQSHEEFPWLPVAYAEFGTREVPGAKHNPRIVEYLMSTDLAQKYSSLPDETDWCAAFVNWCIKKSGRPVTNSAVVNPWRNWGKASNPPRRGAVTTFLWDDGWAHVSFYLGEVGNYVICLGGNQSDAAWISVYHKKYVTSYRIY